MPPPSSTTRATPHPRRDSAKDPPDPAPLTYLSVSMSTPSSYLLEILAIAVLVLYFAVFGIAMCAIFLISVYIYIAAVLYTRKCNSQMEETEKVVPGFKDTIAAGANSNGHDQLSPQTTQQAPQEQPSQPVTAQKFPTQASGQNCQEDPVEDCDRTEPPSAYFTNDLLPCLFRAENKTLIGTTPCKNLWINMDLSGGWFYEFGGEYTALEWMPNTQVWASTANPGFAIGLTKDVDGNLQPHIFFKEEDHQTSENISNDLNDPLWGYFHNFYVNLTEEFLQRSGTDGAATNPDPETPDQQEAATVEQDFDVDEQALSEMAEFHAELEADRDAELADLIAQLAELEAELEADLQAGSETTHPASGDDMDASAANFTLFGITSGISGTDEDNKVLSNQLEATENLASEPASEYHSTSLGNYLPNVIQSPSYGVSEFTEEQLSEGEQLPEDEQLSEEEQLSGDEDLSEENQLSEDKDLSDEEQQPEEEQQRSEEDHQPQDELPADSHGQSSGTPTAQDPDAETGDAVSESENLPAKPPKTFSGNFSDPDSDGESDDEHQEEQPEDEEDVVSEDTDNHVANAGDDKPESEALPATPPKTFSGNFSDSDDESDDEDQEEQPEEDAGVVSEETQDHAANAKDGEPESEALPAKPPKTSSGDFSVPDSNDDQPEEAEDVVSEEFPAENKPAQSSEPVPAPEAESSPKPEQEVNSNQKAAAPSASIHQISLRPVFYRHGRKAVRGYHNFWQCDTSIGKTINQLPLKRNVDGNWDTFWPNPKRRHSDSSQDTEASSANHGVAGSPLDDLRKSMNINPSAFRPRPEVSDEFATLDDSDDEAADPEDSDDEDGDGEESADTEMRDVEEDNSGPASIDDQVTAFFEKLDSYIANKPELEANGTSALGASHVQGFSGVNSANPVVEGVRHGVSTLTIEDEDDSMDLSSG